MPDFTGYVGNSGLGIGSNAGIPAIDSQPLSVINQTGRDILLLNHENNIKRFDQKVKDREKQLELLDSGQVQTREILDKDRPEVKKYQDAANKEFEKFTKAGGINNPQAYKEYQGKIKELKDAITHAQYRYVGRKQLEKEMSDQPIPSMQEDYGKHLKKEDDNSFWQGEYSPYQHSLTLDMDAIKKQAAINPFEYNVDEKGNQTPEGKFKVSGTKFDYEKTKNNLRDKYLQNTDDLYHQQQLLGSIDKMPPAKKVQTVEAMNAQIQKYNTENNLSPGQAGFATPVTLSPTGKIAETPTDFSAKWVLAEQGAFQTKKSELDKFNAQQELKKQQESDKLKIERGKLGLGYAKLALGWAKLKPPEQEKEFNQIYTRNILEQPTLATMRNGQMTTEIPAESSLPVYTIKKGNVAEVKPFGATAVYEHPDAKGKDKGKIVGYTGGYYKLNYITPNNRPVNNKTLVENYKKAQQTDPNITFDDFIKQSISDGYIDYTVQGEDGTTDRKISFAAQRVISNKATKKDQEFPFIGDEGSSTDNTPQD